MLAGSRTLAWDGIDNRGARVSSGTYFVRVTAASQTQTMKLTLLK
jgi:flagellar hook assembly protein FlgD